VITVEADDLDVEVDAFALVEALAVNLGEHYARQLLRGQRPEGGALPPNSKGEPLGRGDGTIATNWVVEPASGSKARAKSATGPYQEGGYHYAVRAMVDRGASPVSSDGKAGDIIIRIVDEAADRAVGL
jgi:hypothetical protein